MTRENKKNMLKSGLKSKYKTLNIEAKLDSIRGWVNHGIDIKSLCKILKINKRDFVSFQKKFPEFRDATSGSAELTNGSLLNTAFRLANGFYAEEVETVKLRDVKIIDGKAFPVEKVETVRTKKFIPPNTNVNMFMIKSRIKSYGENYSDDSMPAVIKITLDDSLQQWAE
nr:MAG TPA: terminase small subunit [Caudoviricetes sp.]